MCKRCGGSLLPEHDIYGRYVTCLSCGYVKDEGALGLTIEQERDLVAGAHDWERVHHRRPQHGKIMLG